MTSFFIVTGDQGTQLPPDYARFGKVVKGDRQGTSNVGPVTGGSARCGLPSGPSRSRIGSRPIRPCAAPARRAG